MDTYFLKLKGKSNIAEPLKIDSSYKIVTDCTVTEKKENSNEDGTYNVTFLAEVFTVEAIDSTGKILKGKDPRRNSQKIRDYLFKCYALEGYTEDFNAVYDMFTNEVMSHTPQLLKSAISRLNQ